MSDLYRQICEVNKYLYQELEHASAMCKVLARSKHAKGLVTKYNDYKSTLLKDIEHNLERLEIYWINQASRDQKSAQEKKDQELIKR